MGCCLYITEALKLNGQGLGYMYAVCWDLCCRAFVDSAYKLSMIEYHAVLFRVSSTRQCFNSNAQPDVLGMKSERQKSELRMLRIIMQYIRGNVFGQVYLAMPGEAQENPSRKQAGRNQTIILQPRIEDVIHVVGPPRTS